MTGETVKLADVEQVAENLAQQGQGALINVNDFLGRVRALPRTEGGTVEAIEVRLETMRGVVRSQPNNQIAQHEFDVYTSLLRELRSTNPQGERSKG